MFVSMWTVLLDAEAQKLLIATRDEHTRVSTPDFFALSSPATPAMFDMTRTTDADDSAVCV